MATVQQKTRLACLCFHESKSFVAVQRIIRLEHRSCQSPSKNFIKRWYGKFNPLLPKTIGTEGPQSTGTHDFLFQRKPEFTPSQKPQ
ncbi:hypothetical protein AVEN_12585-1 [Araneus ventricosus]|uniref:Uncharacterized protein n=1 Tax=Araneus ventricosus TaxID=182803 RepID=A0A4Y2AAW6_ARAVE|nr:hypothetical protein AVEN_12585-1 [Araneus ventricosus]